MRSTSTNEGGDPPERTRHAAVVLAAGRGKRMRSDIPKVLHPIAGRPLIEHVATAIAKTAPLKITVTIGPSTEGVKDVLDAVPVDWAWQPDADGTASAVRVALDSLPADARWLLVVNGDVPLITSEDLTSLLDTTVEREPLVALLAFQVDDAAAYGRVVIEAGEVTSVVEAADAGESKSSGLVNSGVYCFDLAWLRESIGQVQRSAAGEYYLTSLISRAYQERRTADLPGTIAVEGDPASLLGVDDRERLAQAESEMQRRIQSRLMQAGVTIVQPSTTYIELDVDVGMDSRIEPGTILRRGTSIGARCVVGPHSVIEDSQIGDECLIRSSWLESCRLGDRVTVGPYAHLRHGTVIDDDVHVGNYAEIKNARVQTGSKVPHFSYLGDAEIGRDVNVGAGTITCNYDGVEKHRTNVGDHVFLGSDTLLIAPVDVGDNARTGAGAVVTRSVPPGKTVVGMPARAIDSRRAARERHDDS